MKIFNYILILTIIFWNISCDDDTIEPKDCAGVIGGNATEDECGICDANSANDNITCFDCAGTLNGIHEYDECNICDNYTTFGGEKPNYPYGECDCIGDLNGTAVIDDCGECVEGTTGKTRDYLKDECGVCRGDNSTCTDCAGVIKGNSLEDNCGVCDDDTSNDCVEDCNGDWGGTAEEDNCGICEGDGSTCIVGCTNQFACNYNSEATEDDDSCTFAGTNYDCDGNCITELDCNGDCGGNAAIDCSGECRGGETGLETYEICGCFEEGADNYFCNTDAGSCQSDGTNCADECVISSQFYNQSINPYTETGENNVYYGKVFNTGCEYWGCSDINASNYAPEIEDDPNTPFVDEYTSAATNCEDGTLESCCEYFYLNFTYQDSNGLDVSNDLSDSILEVYITNSIPIGGFQFDIPNMSLTGVVDGDDELANQSGFTSSANNSTVIGFSLTGNTIPESENRLLLRLTFSEFTLPLCFSNLVLSDINGNSLAFQIGDCISE